MTTTGSAPEFDTAEIPAVLPDDAALAALAPTSVRAGGLGAAHAKVIVLGEHSVVYGRPAVAVPMAHLRAHAEARAVEGEVRLVTEEFSGSISELPDRLAAAGIAVVAALEHLGHPIRGVEVRVRSGIPAGRGLGASAATAHAIVEAVRSHVGGMIEEDDRFDLVQTAEREAHGRPSGLDARVTRATTPVLFQGGAIRPLQFAGPINLVVADTGIRGSTREAVSRVRRVIESDPRRGEGLLDELGALALAAADDLTAGDLRRLGARMLAAQAVLEELGVGHESIDRLVDAALGADALGAKLTGGGQGGCVVAVAPDTDSVPRIIEAMERAGAVGSWTVGLEA